MKKYVISENKNTLWNPNAIVVIAAWIAFCVSVYMDLIVDHWLLSIAFILSVLKFSHYKGFDTYLSLGKANVICSNRNRTIWHVPYHRILEVKKEFIEGDGGKLISVPSFEALVIYTIDKDKYMVAVGNLTIENLLEIQSIIEQKKNAAQPS